MPGFLNPDQQYSNTPVPLLFRHYLVKLRESVDGRYEDSNQSASPMPIQVRDHNCWTTEMFMCTCVIIMQNRLRQSHSQCSKYNTIFNFHFQILYFNKRLNAGVRNPLKTKAVDTVFWEAHKLIFVSKRTKIEKHVRRLPVPSCDISKGVQGSVVSICTSHALREMFKWLQIEDWSAFLVLRVTGLFVEGAIVLADEFHLIRPRIEKLCPPGPIPLNQFVQSNSFSARPIEMKHRTFRFHMTSYCIDNPQDVYKLHNNRSVCRIWSLFHSYW